MSELLENKRDRIRDALEILDLHFENYSGVKSYAEKYGHPAPVDTRGWSQILASALTGILGLKRKKGSDLEDGSDVKGASTWGAIDTPRFNGVIKAGTKSNVAGKLESLDAMPYLFFVLWDLEEKTLSERCRIWVVRTQKDKLFREMARSWYEKVDSGNIRSTNFQLHPPRNLNNNIFRNMCGNLKYPLMFAAVREEGKFASKHYSPETLDSGLCTCLDPS